MPVAVEMALTAGTVVEGSRSYRDQYSVPEALVVDGVHAPVEFLPVSEASRRVAYLVPGLSFQE